MPRPWLRPVYSLPPGPRAPTFPTLLWRSSLALMKKPQSLRPSWRHSCLPFCRRCQSRLLNQPKQPKTIVETEAEQARKIEEAKAEADAQNEEQAQMARTPTSDAAVTPQLGASPNEGRVAVLTGGPQSTPAPTPTKEQQAQRIATTQVGHMLDALGFGEPQWPEAVGVALALDNSDYVVRAILIDAPDAKKLPLPFVPQLISGPSYASDGPSVLPDDTEGFVTASIDFLQTYDGMRKAAETKTKAEAKQVPAGGTDHPLEPYAEFEKKAGIKIKDDLLPVFGNEIALAGSLKTLQGAGGMMLPSMPSAPPSPEAGDAKDKKKDDAFPMLLLAVKD